MKSFKLLSSLALLGILVAYSGCSPKSDPAPSAQDQQLTKLSKTWKCTAATLDNTAQTGYTNFTITVSGVAGNATMDYATTGRPAGTKSTPWNSAGTLTFGSDVGTQLIRDDGLPITYSVTDTQLQITYNYQGVGYDARIGTVKGTWVMTFGL